MRDKLKELLANPDKVAAYKAQSSDFICNKYNWDSMVEQTEALYRSAIKKVLT